MAFPPPTLLPWRRRSISPSDPFSDSKVNAKDTDEAEQLDTTGLLERMTGPVEGTKRVPLDGYTYSCWTNFAAVALWP